MVVLFNDGDHVPEIGEAFVELSGNGAITPPAQTAGTALNVGVVGVLFIPTVIVTGTAQGKAAFGVNVYVVVAVLFIAGDHVPVIAGIFVEEVDNVNGSPIQNGPI